MSKFLPAFTRLEAQNTENRLSILYGDNLYVEEVPPPEVRTSSGLILASDEKRQANSIAANRPLFVQVLRVGVGYTDDETKKDIPLNVKPGDILLIAEMSVKWFSYYGPLISETGRRIGVTREAEIIELIKGTEANNRQNAVLGGEKL